MDHLTKLEELLDRANNEIKNGAYENASNLLEKIIGMDPNFGKAYNHLAFLYDVKFKEYEKAETLYKLCIEKTPMYPSVYFNYAILLSNIGKYDELKELLDTSINIPGVNKASMFYEYGIMYEKQGRIELAIDNYQMCGRNSLDQKQIDRAKAAIKRCESKKDFF